MELQQFINFLKRNNCYKQFIEDFINYPTKWRLDRKAINIEEIEKIFLFDNGCSIIWLSLTFPIENKLPNDKYYFWDKVDKLWITAFKE